MRAPPLNAPEVIKETDAEMLAVIKNGKGEMPAFSSKLTDTEMSTLVAHIRAMQK